jgi:hypothetical protein
MFQPCNSTTLACQSLLAHTRTCCNFPLLRIWPAAVNDAPSFAKGANTITVLEDADTYSSIWATNISAGPRETDQTTTFIVNCTNAALFSAAPQLSPAGLLTFTVAASTSGSSACSVALADSEGATSAAEQLSIVVTAGELLHAVTQQFHRKYTSSHSPTHSSMPGTKQSVNTTNTDRGHQSGLQLLTALAAHLLYD